jgi:hypothetical protein
MSLAGREVLKRHQYGAEMASCVLMVSNPKMRLCVGDSQAGYDLLTRRGDFGHLPPYERWKSEMRFAGDQNGRHTVVKARGDGLRAFADLTFEHVVIASKGVIEVPPAFVGFGEVEWPAAKMGDVSFQYAPAPEPPGLHETSTHEWIGLIDDLATLVEIALGYRNNEQMFAAEMQRQMQQLGR